MKQTINKFENLKKSTVCAERSGCGSTIFEHLKELQSPQKTQRGGTWVCRQHNKGQRKTEKINAPEVTRKDEIVGELNTAEKNLESEQGEVKLHKIQENKPPPK